MFGDDVEFVHMFNTFFNSSKMYNTYKPIFLKSLLDLGKYDIHRSNNNLDGAEWISVDGETVTLDLNFIAVRFIKYYWDMEHSFKLKHSPSAAQDANIVEIINDAHKRGKYKNPPTIEDIASPKNKDLRLKVIKKSIKPNVLSRLLNMGNLYEIKKKSNEIELKTSLIPFLKKHRTVIQNGINYRLTAHLEKYNKFTPQIAAKIGDETNYPPRTLADPDSKKMLDCEQEHRCFYCDKQYYQPKQRHIDHVIPFNYIFATDVFNCVAACKHCNLTKHDRLPGQESFDEVVKRNVDFQNQLTKLPSTVQKSFRNYDESWYVKTYCNCIDEYNGNSLFFTPLLGS